MAVKTITIKEEVYKKLLELKNDKKSFSEVISELIDKRENILRKYKGILKDSDVLTEIGKELIEERKRIRVRI